MFLFFFFVMCLVFFFVFFFNDTATTEIYTLSLHDALPISSLLKSWLSSKAMSMASSQPLWLQSSPESGSSSMSRSEEHTSELQSLRHLVCRLLLEKKKKGKNDVYLNKIELYCSLLCN